MFPPLVISSCGGGGEWRPIPGFSVFLSSSMTGTEPGQEECIMPLLSNGSWSSIDVGYIWNARWRQNSINSLLGCKCRVRNNKQTVKCQCLNAARARYYSLTSPIMASLADAKGFHQDNPGDTGYFHIMALSWHQSPGSASSKCARCHMRGCS